MHFDPLALNPERGYCFENDEMVREIMLKLGVPDLFLSVPNNPHSPMFSVGFDNHPTHWICFTLWQGNEEYSHDPNTHKGLTFDAYSKKSTPRVEFLEHLTFRLGSDCPAPVLSQFPIFE